MSRQVISMPLGQRNVSLTAAVLIAWFYKHVLGESGQEGDICQCAVDLDALHNAQAIDLAKRMFCEMQGVMSGPCMPTGSK
jgi:hypothetical protein